MLTTTIRSHRMEKPQVLPFSEADCDRIRAFVSRTLIALPLIRNVLRSGAEA